MVPFDIVTVAHGSELRMLKLQARSIRTFVEDNCVEAIVVVNNDSDSAAFRAAFHRDVIGEYGPMEGRVKFVEREELFNGFTGAHGWQTQQVSKLIAVSRSQRDYCLVLDAKNHFVRPVTSESYRSADGRLKSCTVSHRGHQEKLFNASYEYFGVDPALYISETLPNVTPLPLRTATVRDMLGVIERGENRGFPEFFFKSDRAFAEFFLLAGYIAARDGSLAKEYMFGARAFVTVFSGAADAGSFLSIMYQLANENSLAFAIHWAARPLLTEPLRLQIAEVWLARGLVASQEEALWFLSPPEEKS